MNNKKPSISKVRLKNFRKKIRDIHLKELELRVEAKLLYDQLVLDVEDNETALRYVRQAYFQVQKYRYQKQLQERMEFHPFFGAHPMSSHYFRDFESDEEDDEDGIL